MGEGMKISVLGAGSWGTALALQLCRANNDVFLWERSTDRAKLMQQERKNVRYLTEFSFPDNLFVTSSLELATRGADMIVLVVPSQAMRSLLEKVLPFLSPTVPICCASKGIEQHTLMTMEEVLRDVLPVHFHAQLSFLAGPSFAKEVASGLPTTVVVASRFTEVASQVAEAFHAGKFRVYHTDDIIGAELGGALKNVIAIACGVADGYNLGLNARAGLMTRGLAEISRLAVKRGANPLTLSGLAGMGDLVLTCTGNLSRNRRVGLGLGKGKKLAEILEELGEVAEGVITTTSAWELAQKEGIDMPITEQIYGLLYEDKLPQQALNDLFNRERRAERG
jgi:glycerol-3-phosphate dehydrogenase (NAD(P)+)